MPESGTYILSNVGFSPNETPQCLLQQGDSFFTLSPLSQTLTLRFNTTQRFCIGWGDITTGEKYVCPSTATLEPNYEQCSACQQRTGFNPAFYHAAQVSPQQDARNQEPHLLYLAYFSKDTIKVGISYAARGNARLLEQGARFALILDTFPTAHIARSYEAKIAAMPGIAETIQLRKKISLLDHTMDSEQATSTLNATRAHIEEQLHVVFSPNHVLSLDSYYFPSGTPDFSQIHDCSDTQLISGTVTGMLGPLLFCSQEDSLLFLPIKKLIGFTIDVSYEQTPIELPPQQISLF